MKKFPSLVLFLSATCGVLHAIPLRFIAWDDATTTRKIGVVSSKGVDPLDTLHTLHRSKPISVTPGEGGVILRALDRTSPDGKPVDFKVEKAAGFASPLIILLPDPKAPSGVTAIAMEDSRDNFPWGTYRLVNTTGKPLGFVWGKEKKMLPASWEPVDIKINGEQPFQMALYSQESPTKPVFTTVWAPKLDRRRLVIMASSKDSRLGSIALKIIPEMRADVENAQKVDAGNDSSSVGN